MQITGKSRPMNPALISDVVLETRYSNSLNCIMLVETNLTQVEAYYISLADVETFTVHLCFIMSPGKMIFAVLEL